MTALNGVGAQSAQVAQPLSEAERIVVDGIADYYLQNDGMPINRGRVIGWLIVCDPPRQSVAEICARLGVTKEDVDGVAEQLVPANVLVQENHPDGGYHLSMTDESWPNAVRHVFANFPDFHRILASGLEILADAHPRRRERLARLERLFGFLAAEIPAVLDRHAAAAATRQHATPDAG